MAEAGGPITSHGIGGRPTGNRVVPLQEGNSGALAVFQSKAAARRSKRAAARGHAAPLGWDAAGAGVAGRSLEAVMNAPAPAHQRPTPPRRLVPLDATHQNAQGLPPHAHATHPHAQGLPPHGPPPPPYPPQAVGPPASQLPARRADARQAAHVDADDASGRVASHPPGKHAAALVGELVAGAVQREYHAGELGLRDAAASAGEDAETPDPANLPREAAAKLYGVRRDATGRHADRPPVLGAAQTFPGAAVAELQARAEEGGYGSDSDGEGADNGAYDLNRTPSAFLAYAYHRMMKMSSGTGEGLVATLLRRQHFTSEDGARFAQAAIFTAILVVGGILLLVVPDVGLQFWLRDGGYSYEPGNVTLPANVTRLELNITECHLHIVGVPGANETQLYVHRVLSTPDVESFGAAGLDTASTNGTATLVVANNPGCAGSIANSACYHNCFVALFLAEKRPALRIDVNVGGRVDGRRAAESGGANATATGEGGENATASSARTGMASGASANGGGSEVVVEGEGVVLEALNIEAADGFAAIRLLEAPEIRKLDMHVKRGSLQSTPFAHIRSANVHIGKGFVEVAQASTTQLFYRTAKSRVCLQAKALAQPGAAVPSVARGGMASLAPCTMEGAAAFFDERGDGGVEPDELGDGMKRLGLVAVTDAELARRDALLAHMFGTGSNATTETLSYAGFEARLGTAQAILEDDFYLFAPSCFQVASLSTATSSADSAAAANTSNAIPANLTSSPANPLDGSWLSGVGAESTQQNFFATVEEGAVHFQVQAYDQDVASLDGFYKGFAGGPHPSVDTNQSIAKLQAEYLDGKHQDALVYMSPKGPGVPNDSAWTWASRRVYIELGPAILAFLSAGIVVPEISSMQLELSQGFCEKSTGAVVYQNFFEWSFPLFGDSNDFFNRNGTSTGDVHEQRATGVLSMLMDHLPKVVDGKPYARSLWLRRAYNDRNLSAVSEETERATRLYLIRKERPVGLAQLKEWLAFPWYRRRPLSVGEKLRRNVIAKHRPTSDVSFVADESDIASPSLVPSVWTDNPMIVVTIVLSCSIGAMCALILLVLVSTKLGRAIAKHRSDRVEAFKAMQINKGIVAEKSKAFGEEVGLDFDPIARRLRSMWGNLFLRSSGWVDDAQVDDLSPEGTAAKWRDVQKQVREALPFGRNKRAQAIEQSAGIAERLQRKSAALKKRGNHMMWSSFRCYISYVLAKSYWTVYGALGITDSYSDVQLTHGRYVTFRLGSALATTAAETVEALAMNTNPADGQSAMRVPHQSLVQPVKASLDALIAAIAEIERAEDPRLVEVVDRIGKLVRKRRPTSVNACIRELELVVTAVESKGANLGATIVPTRVRSSLPSLFQAISDVTVHRFQGVFVNSLKEFIQLQCYRDMPFAKVQGIGGNSGILLPGDFPNAPSVALLTSPQAPAVKRLNEMAYVSVRQPSTSFMPTLFEHLANFRIFKAIGIAFRSMSSAVSGSPPLICTHVSLHRPDGEHAAYWTAKRDLNAHAVASKVAGGDGSAAFDFVLDIIRRHDASMYRTGAPSAGGERDGVHATSFLLRGKKADSGCNVTYALENDDEGVVRSLTMHYARSAEVTFRTQLRKFRVNYLRFCRKSQIDAMPMDEATFKKVGVRLRDRFALVVRGMRRVRGSECLEDDQRFGAASARIAKKDSPLAAFLLEANVEITRNMADHAVLIDPLMDEYVAFLGKRGKRKLAKAVTESSFCAEMHDLTGLTVKREKYSDLFNVMEMPSGGPDSLRLNVVVWLILQFVEVLSHVAFVLVVPMPAMAFFVILQNTHANIESLTAQETGTAFMGDLKRLVYSPEDGFALQEHVQPTFLYGCFAVVAWYAIAILELGNYYLLGERLNLATRVIRLLFYAVLDFIVVVTCAYIVSAFCWIVLGVIINPNIFMPYVAAAGTLCTSVTSNAKALAKKASNYQSNLKEKNAKKFELKLAEADANDTNKDAATEGGEDNAAAEAQAHAAAPAPAVEPGPGPVVESYAASGELAARGAMLAPPSASSGEGGGGALSKAATESDNKLYSIFSRYSGEDDMMDYREFRELFHGLNVSIPEDKLQQLFARADSDNSGEIGFKEFKNSWQAIQDAMVEEAMAELGMSPQRRAFLVSLGALVLVCMFVFIFVGVKAFLGSEGTVGAVVNSGLCVGGGGAMQGAKPKEEVDEDEVGQKVESQEV